MPKEEFQRLSSKENQNFINLIKDLSTQIEILSPIDLFNYLITKINYEDYLTNQNNSKSKMHSLFNLKAMIEEIKSLDNHKQATLNFINSLYLSSPEASIANSVNLMTIHQSKGLEFKVVILVECNTGILPSYKITKEQLEEERRVCYVGVTRAIERLYIFSSIYKNPTSQFVLELGII